MTSISELTFFGTPVVHLKEINSTNEYLKTITTHAPMLVIADYQTEGRGQYGNVWESGRSKNLCFSFQFYPKNLAIDQGFKISQYIALAIVDSLNEIIIKEKAYIKWPNDIIIKDNKVAGILIESSISQNKIEKIIVGIGVNVNQTEFSDHLPNASSLAKLFPEKIFKRTKVLNAIIKELEHYLNCDFQRNFQREFNETLYKINECVYVKIGEKIIHCQNLGVNENGHWILRRMADGGFLEIKSSREIRYLFDSDLV